MVRDQAWPRTPIGHFLLSAQEKAGLTPTAEASKRTLIHRFYFDLIGLPPTPQEIADFIEDRAPKAYENLVDHLLASPHYGERWGRHWLDLARYADSMGFPSAGAWTTYGLGTENQNLPGFVVMPKQEGIKGGAGNWGAGFLPGAFQGTLFRSGSNPILNLKRICLSVILKLVSLHDRSH